MPVRFLIVVLLVFGSDFALAGKVDHPLAVSEPLLVILQDSGPPLGESDTAYKKYPLGLVAAVWSDGRTIRAVDRLHVGSSYLEGHAYPKEFNKFVAFLTSNPILLRPDFYSAEIDSPCRTIIIRFQNKKHEWTRTVPSKDKALAELENRTWRLPLAKIKSAPRQATDWRQFESK
jgi:hypothetical protein